jgi:subtilase family serine protease
MRLGNAPGYGQAVPLVPAVAAALLAALTVSAPSASLPSAAAAAAGGTADCMSVTTCYTPEQIQVAYGIWPLLAAGFDGSGETVVLPEAAEQQLDPPLVSDIWQDLAGFDQRFRLPAPRLQVTTRFAPGSPRGLSYYEETLDVEMVHAIAPAAAIDVVLFPQSTFVATGSLISAVVNTLRLSISRGDVVSISMGVGENCVGGADLARLQAALRAAASHHVTVVAGSGDTGPVGVPCLSEFPLPGAVPDKVPSLPASDPLVLSVGGTSLTASHQTGAYEGETAWSLPIQNRGVNTLASGGGFSQLFGRPAYQDGVRGIGRSRGVPDVSADASTHNGMALVVSNGNGTSTILPSGGTSAAAPFWAGLIALADQYAGHDLGFVNPALYCIARSPAYHQAFHDITTGNNTVTLAPDTIAGYTAGPGWDPVTGWGSPDGAALVPLLAGYACY